jgi:tRNA modification GTPase
MSGGEPVTTIAAISSPPGGGRRGVIRLSGPDAEAIVGEAFEAETPLGTPADPFRRRGVRRGRFDDGRGGQPALLFWMPSPRSYTGEDVAELHLPGAPPLLAAAMARLLELGAQPASGGDFTRRAFLNGRLDLTRAEGVVELIEASDERERRAASLLLEGGLGGRVSDLREAMEGMRALCEASLDFEESDTGHVPSAELAARAAEIADSLTEALGWEVRRHPPSALPRVVLAGEPNAGKSSLFNALTRVEFGAIVSDRQGTTRDSLAARWELPHSSCLLLDGPGLDPAASGVDRRAQDLAGRERDRADLVLWVVDASGGGESPPPLPAGAHRIVWSKVDLVPPSRSLEGGIATSARTGAGIDALAGEVEELLSGGSDQGGESGPGRELLARHHRALEDAGCALAAARAGIDRGDPLDLCAQSLREATDALDAIVGTTTPEALLDRIFSRFCIGK